MNPSTQDEIKGTVHEVKGKIQETAGKVANSPNLEAEGNAEKNTGKVEKKSRADRKSVREVNSPNLCPERVHAFGKLMYVDSLTYTYQPHEPTTSAHEPASLLPPPSTARRIPRAENICLIRL
jgi:uncharacterized protein YjbJ (UPF0337 family)